MATSSYTADGHVVGPASGGTVAARTLGTTDGGVPHPGKDGFLMNASGSDRITLHFARPVYAASFDYEIFPNGQVPDGTRTDPHHYPDFTFKADGLTLLHTVSVLPGTAGTFAHSLASARHDERAPQLLGRAAFDFPAGVTTLEFVDWPEKVGIDNLRVSCTPVAHASEPSSLVLLGCGGLVGLLALAPWRKRRPTPRPEWREQQTASLAPCPPGRSARFASAPGPVPIGGPWHHSRRNSRRSSSSSF